MDHGIVSTKAEPKMGVDPKDLIIAMLDTISRNPGPFVHGPAGYDGGDQIVSRIISDMVGRGLIEKEQGEQFIQAGWQGIRRFRAAERAWPSEEEQALRRSPHKQIMPVISGDPNVDLDLESPSIDALDKS